MGYVFIFYIMFTLLSLMFNPLRCDAPEPWQLGFQDGATPTYEGITELHNSFSST
jgi:cytochrome c oxidase subunit 2